MGAAFLRAKNHNLPFWLLAFSFIQPEAHAIDRR